MAYNIKIQDFDTGQPVAGTFFIMKNGTDIGEATVPQAGADIDYDFIGEADSFRITAPGYVETINPIEALQFDTMTFRISKQPAYALYIVGGAFLGWLLTKLFHV